MGFALAVNVNDEGRRLDGGDGDSKSDFGNVGSCDWSIGSIWVMTEDPVGALFLCAFVFLRVFGDHGRCGCLRNWFLRHVSRIEVADWIRFQNINAAM